MHAPPLFLISKKLAGTTDERASTTALSAQENEAIAEWWQRCPTSDQVDASQGVLRRMRHGSMWLGCLCRGSVSGAPLMSVVQRDDELYLRRLADRPLHNESCLYFREHLPRGENLSVTAEQLKEGLRTRPAFPPSFYELDADIALPDAPAEDQSTPSVLRQHRVSLPGMARRMFWLLDQASAHVLPQQRDIVRRMIAVARTVGVGESTLDRFMFFAPSALAKQLPAQVAHRCNQLGIGKYAYVMAPVMEVTDRAGIRTAVIAYKDERAELPIVGTFSEYGSSAISFPKLGLFSVDERGNALSAYLHPIYKVDYWIAVDSVVERRVLGWLWKTMIDLSPAIAPNCEVRITKPIYAEPGEGALPDIRIDVLDRDGEVLRRMAIEVLGFTDDEYRARKAAQAITLRTRYSRYLSLDAAGAVDWAEIRTVLREFVA